MALKRFNVYEDDTALIAQLRTVEGKSYRKLKALLQLILRDLRRGWRRKWSERKQQKLVDIKIILWFLPEAKTAFFLWCIKLHAATKKVSSSFICCCWAPWRRTGMNGKRGKFRLPQNTIKIYWIHAEVYSEKWRKVTGNLSTKQIQIGSFKKHAT